MLLFVQINKVACTSFINQFRRHACWDIFVLADRDDGLDDISRMDRLHDPVGSMIPFSQQVEKHLLVKGKVHHLAHDGKDAVEHLFVRTHDLGRKGMTCFAMSDADVKLD